MIRTMATLDPSWRTLYMYGGNMLGVCDKVDEADVIFKLGHQNLPGRLLLSILFGNECISRAQRL